MWLNTYIFWSIIVFWVWRIVISVQRNSFLCPFWMFLLVQFLHTEWYWRWDITTPWKTFHIPKHLHSHCHNSLANISRLVHFSSRYITSRTSVPPVATFAFAQRVGQLDRPPETSDIRVLWKDGESIEISVEIIRLTQWKVFPPHTFKWKIKW